jgi:formylglycine-generating enzyme required for sulfatase activity
LPQQSTKGRDIDLKVLTAEQETAPRPKVAFKECSKCPEMVVVPAGYYFMMGSPDDESNRQPAEGPKHSVTIPRPFAVGWFAATSASGMPV